MSDRCPTCLRAFRKTVPPQGQSESIVPKQERSSRTLSDALVADFTTVRGSRYVFSGPRDMGALKALMAVADDDEIRRRWVVGLGTSNKFLSVNNLGQLRSKWMDLEAPTREAMRNV